MEPDGPVLLRALLNARGRMMSAMTLLEASLVLARRTDGPGFWEPLDLLVSAAKIEVVAFDAEQAWVRPRRVPRIWEGQASGRLEFRRLRGLRSGEIERHPASL